MEGPKMEYMRVYFASTRFLSRLLALARRAYLQDGGAEEGVDSEDHHGARRKDLRSFVASIKGLFVVW